MKKNVLVVLSLLLLGLNSYSQDFIKREGKVLKYKGEEIHLRGMAFGNLVYEDNRSPAQHHSEIDLQRVRSLGMNAIRFYLNYKTFESDASPYTYKQSGWDWLDKNVEWAKNNGIFLILNMHVPQGGYQSTCNGDALWTNPENQNRLAALWKAIAERYKDEPQIGAYDILNEPTPSGSIQNWSNLAQQIIDSIRSVDANHLIITERALALNCDYSYSDANNNYPQITEENLMYTVHLYDPYEFTHQNLDWANTGDGGQYPDEDLLTPPADATYYTGNYTNPSIPSGTTDWKYYTGKPFTVADDKIILGRIVYVTNKIGAGKVYFDDFELKELDANGNEIRTIFSVNPTSGNYWWYSADGTGTFKGETTGHNDSYSLSVSGNVGAASVICYEYSFKVTQGHKYVVSGWMKGENVPVGATATITTEFYNSPSNSPVGARNYQSLVDKITAYSKYIEDKGYPVYFGEFGVARNAFENDKGGDRWVADALHIFDSLGYHFTYHSYKEPSFGFYDGWEKPVDTTTVNKALEKVFRDFFGTTTGLFSPAKGAKKSSLLLYPNPASDYLNIGNPENLKISKIEICDVMGNMLVSSNEPSGIDVHALPKGSYLILMYHTGGVVHGKWIKQ
jgi:endoglucanase